MSPHAYCRDKVARPGSSIYYSSLFVSEVRRRALVAVAALFREIAEATDNLRDAGVARTKLAWWRTEIATIYHGTPRHPVAVALAECGIKEHVAERTLAELIGGAELDLDYNAYPDFHSLEDYCRLTGGVLATLWGQLCGADSSTLASIRDLGATWQLTTIMRDVGEDARRNRIYLPLHELAEHGVTTDDVAHARETDNFRKLMAFQVDRAERRYDIALAAIAVTDRKALRPVITMTAIRHALLKEIRSADYRVLTCHTSLTAMRKLWIAWRTSL